MLSLTIAGGIFLLDYKIKEHIDSTRLQGSKEEVLGGRLLLRNCHNKDKILGKVKIGRENCQELAAAGMGCVAGEYWHQLLPGGNKLSRAGPGHASGWNCTVKIFFPTYDIPSFVPSFTFTNAG